jgi:hypothetical protein
MRTARGARMGVILGASLIACTLPIAAVAAKSDSTASAITAGSTEAITAGSAQAITAGSAQAITAGSGQAITAGSDQAITAGSGQAITAGSEQAITAGSGQAITAGSAQAITAGSGQAITAGSAQAITAGSGQAITAGSGQAITAGSAQAITAGSGQAITAGSAQAITAGSGQAITAGSVTNNSSSPVLLAGPIDSLDYRNSAFVALGQRVMVARGDLGSLRVGDFVQVSGSLAAAGLINADAVTVSSQGYVPGSSEVFVTGIPSSVDYSRGTARIGELTVDYTPSLGGARFQGIGAAITVIGIQPANQGVMLSDQVIDQSALFLRN